MNNTELINGFGDVMQHIRNQEKRIQQLEKEKQELEEKVDEAQVAFKDLNDELYDLREFKKDAEHTCAAHVVMEDMMKRIARAESRENFTKKTLEKEINEKKQLRTEINELEYALEKAELCKCDQCSEYFPIAGIEDVLGVNSINCDMVCLECRDEYYTQCDECMDYHHNTNITNIEDRDVCNYCNSVP